MAKRGYTDRVRCAHEGCAKVALFEFDTHREQQDLWRRLQGRPWKCVRHSGAGEVLSKRAPTREAVLEVHEESYGRFWRPAGKDSGGNGFVHGPGFQAWAEDFQPGTRLIVTAQIDLPGGAT